MGPENDCETVGFIDVGTNSIHLLVVRFYPGTSATPIYQDKETVRLGKSLYSTGRIDEASVRKSALVIDRFAQISRSLGASKVVAFATCAAREAAQSQDLLDAVSEGVDLEVIPGVEEARLIALGVFGDVGPSERTVEIDIGGGSTEVVIREKGEDIFLDSLSMGAVRYNYSMGIDFTHRVSSSDYSHILRSVDIASYHAVNKVRTLGFRKAVGSSGTAIALAADVVEYRRARQEAPPFGVQGVQAQRLRLIEEGHGVALDVLRVPAVVAAAIGEGSDRRYPGVDHFPSAGEKGFNCDEIHEMGLIVRCHHKKFPGARDPRFEGLSKDVVSSIRICAILLKMADCMDRHHNGSVRSGKIEIVNGTALLEMTADADPSMEIWSLEKLAGDFRKVFGIPLVPTADTLVS